MCLMDVITTYLYGSIDNDIYMKIPEGFKLPRANSIKSRSMYSIKLQWSLYGLKQYLLKEGYVNNPICLSIFIKKSETGFAIIAMYVVCWWLKSCWNSWRAHKNNKLLGKGIWDGRSWKNKFCLGLQIEHFPNGVLVHHQHTLRKFWNIFIWINHIF